jgi:hypothetical protein
MKPFRVSCCVFTLLMEFTCVWYVSVFLLFFKIRNTYLSRLSLFASVVTTISHLFKFAFVIWVATSVQGMFFNTQGWFSIRHSNCTQVLRVEITFDHCNTRRTCYERRVGDDAVQSFILYDVFQLHLKQMSDDAFKKITYETNLLTCVVAAVKN